MNIAMIGHKRIPGREGGVETVVEMLSSRLSEQGHHVTAYNRARRGEKILRQYKGVRLKRVPTINRKHLDAPVYSLLATLHALFGGYDVLHYHAAGPCLMLWLPKLLGCRTVATLHGLDWQRAKWGRIASWFLRLGERSAVRHADEVIVLTESMQAYLAAQYGRKSHVIPNGVETPDLCPSAAPLARFGLMPGEYVLFLARLVPEKGLHTLLDAFADVHTNLRLAVAGEGTHTAVYERTVRAKGAGDGRVVFTGFVEGAEKAALYHYTRAYVLPSEVEGQPLALLEAMSHGCPCLVSDIDANRDACQGFAHTFRQGDAHSLRQALQSMLDNPPLHTPEEIRTAVFSRHDFSIITERTLQVYATYD